MHRRDLSDREWAILAPFFPTTPPRRGGQWRDHRTTLSGVFHRLRTGCPWRDLPGRYGPWQTVYERFNHLRRSGALTELLSALQLRLNEAGRIDHSLYCVDGTHIRASRSAAGAAAANAAEGNSLQAQALGQQQLSDFGRQQLGQQQLAQAADQFGKTQALERERLASQERVAGMHYGPQAMKANLMLALANRAVTDPNFDAERIPPEYARLAAMFDGQAGGRTGQPPAANQNPIAGTPPGAAGSGNAPPAVAPDTPISIVNRAIQQMRPAVGSVGIGPGGQTFAPEKQLTPDRIDDLLNRMNGVDLSNPAVQAEFGRRVQRGDLGDVSRLRQAVAQNLARDVMLAMPPAGDGGGRYPGSYELPGLFTLKEQMPDTLLGQFGRRLGRGMAGGIPYNQIRLPSGEIVPFDAQGVSSAFAGPFNNIGPRAEQAKPRLQTGAALLRALNGMIGQRPGS